MSLIKRNREFSPISSMFSDFFDADKFFNLDFIDTDKGILRNVPAVNIKEQDHKYEIELAAPGFNKKDFQISIEENILKISAERKEERSDEK